jgi:ABC-2 type transport system ATP-binding protein
VLSLEKLIKQYEGVRAVDGVSFKVEQGDIYGFLGPNGAGKTKISPCSTLNETPSTARTPSYCLISFSKDNTYKSMGVPSQYSGISTPKYFAIVGAISTVSRGDVSSKGLK